MHKTGVTPTTRLTVISRAPVSSTCHGPANPRCASAAGKAARSTVDGAGTTTCEDEAGTTA